jgi:5'-nucleotidase
MIYFNNIASHLVPFKPWLLSNIVDNTTGTVPEHVSEFYVFERRGIRIGVIGLIEE